jgi:ribosome biogenesis protein BRX1
MDEMKLTGNAMRGSRPILSFDKGFEEQPHWLLVKELFVQVRDYTLPIPFTLTLRVLA